MSNERHKMNKLGAAQNEFIVDVRPIELLKRMTKRRRLKEDNKL